MSLCNVHANLFKGAISDVDVPDAEQEGHPVYVFKQENLALRAAMLRIRRIIENYEKAENEEFHPDLIRGLKHQMSLLGQFQNHYNRKENLFFPVMERYGMMHRQKSCGVLMITLEHFLKKRKLLWSSYLT